MTRPAMNSVATQVYDSLVPFNDLAGKDGEAVDWALAYFVNWLCDSTLQQVAGYAFDGDGGELGWSVLLDLDRVPDEAIKYLAQFVGVTINDALDVAGRKAQIANLESMQRGSASYIRSLLDTLVAAEGSSDWVLRERYDPTNPSVDSAYHFQVIIVTDDPSPDPDPTLLALRKAKPAGLIMHYQRATANDWQYIADNYTDWSDVRSSFTDWDDVRDA